MTELTLRLECHVKTNTFEESAMPRFSVMDADHEHGDNTTIDRHFAPLLHQIAAISLFGHSHARRIVE